ncbi:MAG: alkaline phosphatase family protein [Acidobacteriaceae bacterium]|nr:alkaline phosphatase family protein [Acidobacteriaceae bacterium]
MLKRIATSAFLICLAGSIQQADSQPRPDRSSMGHVLLISIDGMHALDYLNCVKGGYCPNLAALGNTGVNYTRTSTSKPSDSFPGLMALVSGGTPKTVGAFYDVAYDRVLAPPQNTTGNGLSGGDCVQNTPNGTTTEYEEGVDIDQSKLNGGGPYSLTDGGILSIDPTRLPRDPYNRCQPVYPWNFVRTNTIFGVIHAAGGYTAWSDKHAVYDAVGGPTGNSNQANVDDYYSPEINSDAIALPGLVTADGLACSVPGNPPTPPDNNGADWTSSFQNIRCYDQLKVNAILNEILGMNHLGNGAAPVPTIFGMNFQAVSVGQKLIENGVKGGYTDAAGTPTQNLKTEIAFVDAAIGRMVAALQGQGLLSDTLIVITAKHGQSPIDTHRFTPINKTSPANLIANLLPASESPLTKGGIGPTEDDISLLWLSPGANVSDAVNTLETNATAAGIGEIFYGPSLLTMFNAPGLPANGGDSRTPDIIVQPNVGVVYTGSSKKQSEHGGFAHDDTNMMMLLSNPALPSQTVTSFVETTQVAPTILQVLGLAPTSLDAVRIEGTPILPGLNGFRLNQ